jgi:hypothetical protein
VKITIELPPFVRQQIDRGTAHLGCDRAEFVRLACVMLAAELGLDASALTQPANLTERPGPLP